MSSEEIKSVVLLSHLSEEMRKKLAELATIITVKSGEVIFKQGDYAENLYAVLSGKVSLEMEKAGSKPLRIKDIAENYVFGISAMVESGEKTCISHARAVTDVKLVFWKAADLDKLFYYHPDLGFSFMKRITTVLKDRLQIKNAQLASYT
ncbi:cyclic nucleotide-binding domain-containing protein [bacterium]|nr:cyclic nucleotide-binding domain-containing protein [bacterium]